MRYIWIAMLAAIELIWWIATIINIKEAIKKATSWPHDSLMDCIDAIISEMDEYATICIWTHLFIVFTWSFFEFAFGGE